MLLVYTNTRYENKTIGDILFVQGVDGMFELKTNEEIGAYLKKVILSKYPSCRQFCVAYIDLTIDFSDDPQDQRSEEIRKLTNRLSQILKGKKSIQTYDLPVFSELLGISCEQMLSAGAVAKPITILLFRLMNEIGSSTLTERIVLLLTQMNLEKRL